MQNDIYFLTFQINNVNKVCQQKELLGLYSATPDDRTLQLSVNSEKIWHLDVIRVIKSSWDV